MEPFVERGGETMSAGDEHELAVEEIHLATGATGEALPRRAARGPWVRERRHTQGRPDVDVDTLRKFRGDSRVTVDRLRLLDEGAAERRLLLGRAFENIGAVQDVMQQLQRLGQQYVVIGLDEIPGRGEIRGDSLDEFGVRFEPARKRTDLEELSARLVRAQEDERRSLARELHDEVGQSLSAIIMEASNVEFAETPGEMRERVKSIAAVADTALNVVRDLALLLRPSMLDDFGLVPALNWQAREFGKRTGLDIRIDAGDDCDDLPDEHKTCVYRFIQEALNNAARHARAHAIRIKVRNDGDRVLFSVQDDGAGFDKKTVRGLGLLGMEERVRRLGGKFRIESQPGRGTVLSAELPLAEMKQSEVHAAADPYPAG